MRRILLQTTLGAIALIASAAAFAGISLSPIMESWNHGKRAIDAMLAGQAPYDEARVRQELQHYVASASSLARSIKGNTAEARDFAARFEGFANDSRSVLGSTSQPSAMRMSFSRIFGDCQSCHAIYNN
jgi:cytochrome c556